MPDISLTVATLNELIQTYNGTHPTLAIPPSWLADPTTPISIVISKLITGSRPNAAPNPAGAPFLMAVVSSIPSSVSGYNFGIACPTNVVNMQQTKLQEFLEVYNGTRSDLVLPQNALSSPTSYFSLVINNLFAGTAPNAVLRPSAIPYANATMSSIPVATLGFQPSGVIIATHTLQNFLDVYNRQKHDLFSPGGLTNASSNNAKIVANCFTGFSPNAILQPQAVQYANTVMSLIPTAVTGLTITPAPTPAPAPSGTPTDLYLGRFTTVKNDIVNFGGSKLQGVASAVNSTDAVNKANLDSAITAINATIASSSSTDQSYTNTKVAEQASRIDGILSGAGLTLDTLKEVSDFANTLHNTQAQDILTSTTTLTTA